MKPVLAKRLFFLSDRFYATGMSHPSYVYLSNWGTAERVAVSIPGVSFLENVSTAW
jgi:hypothetical protein